MPVLRERRSNFSLIGILLPRDDWRDLRQYGPLPLLVPLWALILVHIARVDRPTSGRSALSPLPASLRACEGCSLPRPKNDGGGLHRAEAQRGESGRRERKEQVRGGE